MVELEAIDLASYHYYPVDWGLTSVQSDALAWINGHQAIAKAAGKVAYWGEFGYKKGASDTEKATIYDQWLQTFFDSSNDGAFALFWQLVPVRRGADDGYAIIPGARHQ